MEEDNIPEGTLIQVNRFHTDLGAPDQEALANDGFLWLIVGLADVQRSRNKYGWLYRCRSLATGVEYWWYTSEFAVAKQEQQPCT